jgi:hypothetical protein
MIPTAVNGPASAVTRLAATPADPRKKAHARLADRIDLARNRHKPLSILRAEGKRTLEQFYDQEGTALTRSDRDRLVEDILAESVGFGPLEEAFRDDAVKEILVLSAATILGRKADDWMPLSGRFRDDDQLRTVLARWADAGEAYVAGAGSSGGFDVRLANGFRAVATLPPAVLEVPPQVWLSRAAPTPPTVPLVPGNASLGSGISVSPISGVHRAVAATPMPRGSGPMPHQSGRPNLNTVPAADNPDSGVISLDSLTAVPTYSSGAQGSHGGRGPGSTITSGSMITDPLAKLRQRITGVIIGKFAAAGMYDLNALPVLELARIILAQVTEIVAVEKLGYDDSTARHLTGEILASIKP